MNGAKVAGETGINNNVVNCPLGRGAGLRAIRRVMEERILPALSSFAPGLVIISLGFDALAKDPIGGLNLDPHDYAYLTRSIQDAAQCKLISVLEGGYDVREIARGAVAHVSELARLAKGAKPSDDLRRLRGASVISELSSGESWGSEQSYGDEDDDVNTLVANMSLDSVADGAMARSPTANRMSMDSVAERPATPPCCRSRRLGGRRAASRPASVEYGADGSPPASPRVSNGRAAVGAAAGDAADEHFSHPCLGVPAGSLRAGAGEKRAAVVHGSETSHGPPAPPGAAGTLRSHLVGRTRVPRSYRFFGLAARTVRRA